MNSEHFFPRTLAIFVLMIGVVSSAFAEERILSYHSEISIAADASMSVVETLRVKVEGLRIQRGIYRDFPTEYSDRYGNNIVVEFDVLDVKRDGSDEPWNSNRRGNGVRIRIGDANILLQPGVYTYTIRYTTSRQIGYFDDHDELYWNVTGNGWEFSIDEVSASVRLPGSPESIGAHSLAIEGYTGLSGSRGQDYVVQTGNNSASIQTTRVLDNREGLTLVMNWPKGLVSEPTQLQYLGYLLKDNIGVLVALMALLASGAYLYFMWRKYGKDPASGVIFPHYDPPKGYSPASARYITEMSYDSVAMSVAVVNLAVKGHLTISQSGDDYSISRQSSDKKLAPGEAVLLEGLFGMGSYLELKQENQPVISAAQKVHKSALEQDYRNIYFVTNAGLLLPSFIGSVLTVVFVAVMGAFSAVVVGLFVANLVLHLLFLYLMKAPTLRGRLFMDKLAGFKQYLEVAEKDDLDLRYSPDLTPELFERYLPFAMALGVQQDWAEKFTKVFATLNAGQSTGYKPVWYVGSFNPMRMQGFVDNVGKGFSNAISSAATPPGSSSGAGGGGFSGGGGGGGGGGGW